MHRFFVEEKNNDRFPLPKEILNHIKVVRIQDKNFIVIFDKEFYICKLNGSDAVIINKLDQDNEFKNDVVLAAPIINLKRFEWMLQKAVELGVTKIIPFTSQNTSLKLSAIANKEKRWNEIIKNAAEQSFRNIIPTLENVTTLPELFKGDYKNIYIAHEKHQEKEVVSLETNSIVIVGPEGGFSDNEISMASKNNATIINLGKRILRAETAALKILSKIIEI